MTTKPVPSKGGLPANLGALGRLLAACAVAAIGLAGCSNASSGTTNSTLASEATFGTYPYWNTFSGPDGYWSTSFVSPYWANFTSRDGGGHWILKTPSDISPRRGIAVTESPGGTKAVGFFAYQGQTDSAVFSFRNSGAKVYFLGGPLVPARQSLGFSGENLFALRQRADAIQITTADSATSGFALRYSDARTAGSPAVAAIGFASQAPQDGVALLGAQEQSGRVSKIVVTHDAGATWNTLAVTLPGGGEGISACYIPLGFGPYSYEFALVDQVAGGYRTIVETSAGASNPVLTPAPPIMGSDPQGDIFLLNSVLGIAPTLSALAVGTLKWSAPAQMGGIEGALESIGFSSKSKGIAISSLAGNLRAFATGDGGLDWTPRGTIAIPRVG